MQLYSDIFLNWKTLVDILLITVGLFFLYRTFLRLGAWKIMLGMLAAFFLFVFASLFNLEGIEWIFENVSHVALLALIIIFQPEIRKIFEKVVSLAVADKHFNSTDTSRVVAESLWSLAAQKRGAIIVFPGKEHIYDKISGGYILKAVPSVPLLMSIFDPHSPGHDGAVVIVDNMLTHLGVRLPMSESLRLSEEYGTRHHAAMGMVETSDALVLLVSEERGTVSSFENGKMARLRSPEEITTAIEKHFSHPDIAVYARSIRVKPRTVLQFVASLLITTVFWSTVIMGQKQIVERTMTIPIEYASPGKGLVLVDNKVYELVVHAAGPEFAMNDFALSGPKALIDLSQMSEGTQTVPVTAENIEYPKEVRLIDISPAELELTLAARIEKSVPITPQLIGQLPNGLKIKRIEVVPAEISVFALPDRQDTRTLSVSTTPIYLNSISGDSRILCKIIAPPSFQPVDKRWPDVEIFIALE